jgi:hypothetical protein
MVTLVRLRGCAFFLNYGISLPHARHRFALRREHDGLSAIRRILDPPFLAEYVECVHDGKDARHYYSQLQKAVEEAFIRNPCVRDDGLATALDSIPDPPLSCNPLPKSANWYLIHKGGNLNDFNCPLQRMTIWRKLQEIAGSLGQSNDQLMGEFFGKDFASG